jgi:G3E family GTPase
VLTGFLGAGKTTLLKQLLAYGGRVGVIMNEVGQTGIEAPLPGDYIELAGGCVCCIVNKDLETTLKEMLTRYELDRVVLETTGLANPKTIVWNLQPQVFEHKLRLDAVVCVVDPTSFERTDNAEWNAQVREADLVLLSKLDLATAEQVDAAKKKVAATNLSARVLAGLTDDVIDAVLGQIERAPRQWQLFAPDSAAGLVAPRPTHSNYVTMNYTTERTFSLDGLKVFLSALPEEVFRAKGFVAVDTGVWCRFHVVAGRIDLSFDTEPPFGKLSRAVFFGPALDQKGLAATIGNCLVEA